MDRRVKLAIGGGVAFLAVLALCLGALFAAPMGGGGAIGGAVGGAAAEAEDREAAAANCGGLADAAAEAGNGVDRLAAAATTGLSGGQQTPSTPAAPPTGGSSNPDSPSTAGTGTVAPTATGGTGTAGAPGGGQPDQMPYSLPATHGFTGAEEPIDASGRVPSTGATVTWPQYAAKGQAWRDYYITMRWGYGVWSWDGHTTEVDQAQFNWFSQAPRLVLVTNPRTHKSIVAVALEAGPAPWVGLRSGGSGGPDGGTQYGYTPGRDAAADYKGIVSGFPPAALAALDAKTGYPGQTGDDLLYQWAPDQTVTPGPTGAAAIDATGGLGSNGCLDVTSGTSCSVTGTYDGLTADQQSNARDIASVALERGLGMDGAVMGIMVAFTESTLVNVPHGDGMGPSSRGLFQQMPSWGPEADRMNPKKSAGFFFDALTKQSGWASEQPWIAAQAVQQSEFSDGSNYQQNYSLAADIAASLLNSPAGPSGGAGTGSGTAAPTATPPGTAGTVAAGGDLAAKWCTGGAAGGGGVQVNGVDVKIPNKPDVPQELWGKTIKAPNQVMARGLAAGFGAIGLPYVWGGGGDGGTPPTDGCDRGGGAMNSCQGIAGYDCSGFTAFVLGSAGFSIPAYSQAQRGGTAVPKSQALPGDLVVFIGHVAMYLGQIDGTEYFLQAPSPGHNVQIRTAYWANSHGPADSDLYRWWK